MISLYVIKELNGDYVTIHIRDYMTIQKNNTAQPKEQLHMY